MFTSFFSICTADLFCGFCGFVAKDSLISLLHDSQNQIIEVHIQLEAYVMSRV